MCTTSSAARLELTVRGGYNDEDNGNGINMRKKHLKRGTEDGLNTLLRHHKRDCVNSGVGYHKHIA